MSLKGTASTVSKTIQLNFNKLCKTTGWHNNCGLNSLTHFLYAKLSTLSEGDFDIFLAENPEYFSLLETFHEYYGLTEKYGWQDVLNMLHRHPVPTDQEALFAPVLRKHLGKVLTEHAEILWNTDASTAISDYIKHGQVSDVAQPVYYSNKAYFDNLKEQFEIALIAQLQTEPTEEELAAARIALTENADNRNNSQYQMTEEEILRHIIFQRRNTLEDNFIPQAQVEWMTGGCQRYANYVANMNNYVMVSADHLQFLCGKLNIGAEIYTIDSMRHALLHPELAHYTGGAQSMPRRKFPWIMKTFNSGAHWIYQEPSDNVEKMKQHNQHYPDVGSEAFYADQRQSGKFKLHGGYPASKDIIIADVKCQLGEISEAQLEEIKQISALAEELERVEMRKMVERKKTALVPSVYTVLNASDAGKKYIALLEKNADALKVINEKFSGALAKDFLQKYTAIVDKVAALNLPSQVSFFEKFVALNKPVMSIPTPIIPQTEQHLLQEAIINSARTMVLNERKGIKLTYFTIMQGNEAAKEIAKLIEDNPAALAVFNQYSEECVRNFVGNPKLPAMLQGFTKLSPSQQILFLHKYPATLQKQTIHQNGNKNGLKNER